MPTPLVSALAKEAGISIEKADDKWKEAKEKAKSQGLTENDGNKFWKIVTTIFKRMIGVGSSESISRAETLLTRIDEAGVSSYLWTELKKYGLEKTDVVKPLIDYIEGRLFKDEALSQVAAILGQEKALLISQILSKFGK